MVSVSLLAPNSFITAMELGLKANNSSISTVPFEGLQNTQQCQVLQRLYPSFDPNEWLTNNGLHNGDSN